MTMEVIGQVHESEKLLHTRIEVLLFHSRHEGSVIYVTKYADGQIGERSIGMSSEAALLVAELLQRAAGHQVR
jgi:hypothetical protein